MIQCEATSRDGLRCSLEDEHVVMSHMHIDDNGTTVWGWANSDGRVRA